MDNFQDIDFDTVQGVTHEIRNLTTRIMGIMDHLDDEEMNDLPPKAQSEVRHLTESLERANNALHSGVDSWINSMWHGLESDEKVQALEGKKKEALQGSKTLDVEHLRPDAAAAICESMMDGDDKERFMTAWNALLSHGGWESAWRWIKEMSGWEDPQEFLDVLSEWHPEAYDLIKEEEITEAHGDWEDE